MNQDSANNFDSNTPTTPSTQASKPSQSKPRVAIIGSGIAGLSAAWHLRDAAEITVFEADGRAGGHAHTVDITLGGQTFGVDTGFLVFNHRTYPGLTPFLDQLGVVTAPSDMGFSVQASHAVSASTPRQAADIEWAGNNLNSVFNQRRNLFKLDFWRMLKDILRFNKAATAYALLPPSDSETLGQYLHKHGYSHVLRDWYLVPMAAAIWSCPTATMMGYPMATFARFCHNHGLLQITNRPQWYTIQGGSRHYVDAVVTQLKATGCDIRLNEAVTNVVRHPQGVASTTATTVTVATSRSAASYDAIVFACHSDQALAMLGSDATRAERPLLGSINYQPNVAVLHTDASVLPSQQRAWAAWNYQTLQARGSDQNTQQVCLHYLLNKLQPLPVGLDHPVIVSLNPLPSHLPDPSKVIQQIEYAHPVFNSAAIAAQQQLPSIQGDKTGLHTWFAGAWTNYGFHEDGFQSGKAAATSLTKHFALAQ